MENVPAPDLVRLETILAVKLQAKEKGQVTPQAFAEFVAKFRSDLSETGARVPPSPANTGLHARILARLQEPGEALARLDEALLQEPDNSTLLNARGYVQLQQGDYSGALASYNQDHGQPADKGALSIKYSSEDRIAGKTPATRSLSPAAPQSQGIAGLDQIAAQRLSTARAASTAGINSNLPGRFFEGTRYYAGVNGVALPKKAVLDAIDALRRAGDIPILGGEIFHITKGKIELSYDNWDTVSRKGPNSAQYRQDSYLQAEARIRAYSDPEDGTILYRIVTGLEH